MSNLTKMLMSSVVLALVSSQTFADLPTSSTTANDIADDLSSQKSIKLSDPLKPFNFKTSKKTQQARPLYLSSIGHTGSRPYAVINDRILYTGSVIYGRKIKSINNDVVIFTNGYRIKLFNSSFVK